MSTVRPEKSTALPAVSIAQIEMSNIWAPRKSIPAAETRPRMVNNSGKPAATRDPKASSKINSVTGQEMTSDFSIALLIDGERLAGTTTVEDQAAGALTGSRAGTQRG